MSASTPGAFEAVGRLLAYPEAGFPDDLRRCLDRLRDVPDAGSSVRRFAAAVDGLSIVQLQERFTETFDLNPVCSLEVGWQLYGEEYARGNFLVGMRQLLRDHDVAESTELPDHLTHLLPLTDRLDADGRRELLGRYVEPALVKMLASFDGTESPYVHVMRAVGALVTQALPAAPTEVAHG